MNLTGPCQFSFVISCEYNEALGSVKGREFLDQLTDRQFLNASAPKS
jgi:hypothetical protein